MLSSGLGAGEDEGYLVNCMSVLLHVCRGTHVSLYTWWSEDNLRSCSSRWDAVSHWPETLQVSLDFWPEPACLCLPSCHYWDGERKPQHMAFGMGSGKQTQALMCDHWQTEPSPYPLACKIWLTCWKRCWGLERKEVTVNARSDNHCISLACRCLEQALNLTANSYGGIHFSPLKKLRLREVGGRVQPLKGWTRDHMPTVTKAQSSVLPQGT